MTDELILFAFVIIAATLTASLAAAVGGEPRLPFTARRPPRGVSNRALRAAAVTLLGSALVGGGVLAIVRWTSDEHRDVTRPAAIPAERALAGGNES